MKFLNETENKKEELNRSLKLIAKSSFIVLIGLIISKILGYVYRILIARYFSPEVYGLFNLALAISSFLISIFSFGFSEGLLRFIPLLRAKKKQNEINYLIKRTRDIYIIFGIISTFLLFFFSDFISNQIFHNASLTIFLKIMSANIFISLLLYIYLGSIRAYEKISWYSGIFNIFQNVARVGVLVILIILGIRSNGSIIVWSWVIASFLTLIVSYAVCRHEIKEIFKKYKKQDYSKLNKEFFAYSWPIIFYSVIGLLLYWIDTFSLGVYKSSLEVGIYNAAVPIAALIGIVPELFMQIFFPMISREYSNKNYKIIEQLSKQVTKWIFMVSLPLFILIFFFPGAALNLLFGEEYLPAENALRILLIGTFISALFAVCNNLISMLGKSKLVLFNIAFAALMNLVLNSILVPLPRIFLLDNSNGMIGAATATLISILFLNALFIFQTKKYLSFIPLKRKMINILIISVIATAMLFYFRSVAYLSIINILLISMLFVLIYSILLLVSKSLDENDWMIIKAVWRKAKGYKKIGK